MARAIIRSRHADGPFDHLGDLERVPGLGPGTLARLGSYVTLPRHPPAPRADRSSGIPAAGPQVSPRRSARGPPGGRIDVNRASAAQLQALPGIGPVRARAIVGWREAHGRFRALADLVAVPGIGPATLERLRSRAIVRP
ncbi:MAG: hypothetical protein GWN07_17110 [Actinobacteria bacterium]|nr:hypothetical protein [Actinomycetota bacterium]NIV87711.1 hypothetical protein [Actinomycetota bacterium]NIW28970.1 hypothetical protein [Actinomycetota bacterium]NIX21455.1 hypothetical protein [Actinomycetota bacterium]